MQFTVKTYLNDGPGRFWQYQPGDRLVQAHTLSVLVDESDDFNQMVTAALEQAFSIGNGMHPDHPYEWRTRSISSGDVLEAISPAGIGYRRSVDAFGFSPVDDFHLRVSLSEFARENDRGRTLNDDGTVAR